MLKSLSIPDGKIIPIHPEQAELITGGNAWGVRIGMLLLDLGVRAFYDLGRAEGKANRN